MLNQFLEDVSTDLVPAQYCVLKNIIDNDISMNILPRAGGKTLLLALAAVFHAVNNKDKQICVAAPVYLQTKFLMQEIQKKFKYEVVFGPDFSVVKLNNNSNIVGLPIGAIKGRKFDCLFVDEYQDLPPSFRQYIDFCGAKKVAVMITDDIGDKRLVNLISNRDRCYKILKIFVSEYPKDYYDKSLLEILSR